MNCARSRRPPPPLSPPPGGQAVLRMQRQAISAHSRPRPSVRPPGTDGLVPTALLRSLDRGASAAAAASKSRRINELHDNLLPTVGLGTRRHPPVGGRPGGPSRPNHLSAVVDVTSRPKRGRPATGRRSCGLTVSPIVSRRSTPRRDPTSHVGSTSIALARRPRVIVVRGQSVRVTLHPPARPTAGPSDRPTDRPYRGSVMGTARVDAGRHIHAVPRRAAPRRRLRGE